MHPATMEAFLDELEQIKTAGMLRDLGTKIVSHSRGAVRNVANTVEAFATPVQSFKKGWKTSVTDFGAMHPAMKTLMGVGLASGAVEALSKKDPYGQNRGRGQRVGAVLGDQVGGVIGAPFGLSGGIAGGMVGRKIGGMAGKAVDIVRGHRDAGPALATKRPTF